MDITKFGTFGLSQPGIARGWLSPTGRLYSVRDHCDLDVTVDGVEVTAYDVAFELGWMRMYVCVYRNRDGLATGERELGYEIKREVTPDQASWIVDYVAEFDVSCLTSNHGYSDEQVIGSDEVADTVLDRFAEVMA